MATSTEQIALIYPWLPPEVLDLYNTAYIEGSVEPWSVVRADSRYEDWFPGNLTDDGQVRYGEGQYAAVRESYADVLRSVQIDNIALFDDHITEMIEGERTPEEFARGVHEAYDRVISASEEIRKFYADANGITDLSTAGLLAGYLDPEIGDQILSGRITMAEIGGEAATVGFDISDEEAERLADTGLNRTGAQTIFGQARELLPTLSVLAKRHGDPDDDFDINNFLQAEYFNDPRENLRQRRILARERASFSAGSSLKTSRSGAAVGLAQE